MAAPPAPFIPEAIHGQQTLVVMFVYDGDPEAGQKVLEPFRAPQLTLYRSTLRPQGAQYDPLAVAEL